MRVELVWSPQAGDVQHRWLDVEEGATLASVLRGCADFLAAQNQPLDAMRIGIWGRVRPLETRLRERDRIEVYRPLTVDPMEARRQRYAKRGQRIVSRHRPKHAGG
ncbi:MAG: RnfH family protein [Burkholderiales bacterium]|nr:RnfH family protein [Burkholderiales bacterium]MBW8892092.1 RnfH family protein [Burkholderiales bacterium]